MAQPANNDDPLSSKSKITVLSKFDVDVKGTFDYKKFRTLCVRLFGADEVDQHEWRAREVFELFDANADGALNDQELYRCCDWIHATINPINVLLVVDVQNDFIDGTLALRKCGYGQEGSEVVEPINRILKDGHWDKVIYTQDWHPENHISFFENLALRELHPKSKITKEIAKPFDTVVFLQSYLTQVLWPRHCVMNTWGAQLHKDLLILPSSERVYKGQDPDKEAYSGFEKNTNGPSELEKILKAIGATHLYICGIAYDVCVKETCLNGLQLGYRVAVINDCCRGVKPDDVTTAKNLIIENGGLVADSDRILSLVNESKYSLTMAHHAAKFIS
ncbi:nicotinamidase isoform X1 [Monomorium pharaonis]|uniref:nicotinamidase isoform X1 n=1 Tax=Monomorium pharaonis TaxID=307658 RepID=UPI00063F8620|nr:nicotinamidase isoform X1 [Monomorium pharaonis]